ncbi:MAG: CdaR family protein [Clostridia bacterium]|jgi:YbbR domain-containing protein|nr:CdaR family protein [Clostridia bacterium]
MYEFLKKDWLYKIAALVLAVLLWFYVTNLQNPVTDKTINVPVLYNGLAEGLIIGEKTENIDVSIRGSSSVLNPLTGKDIKAAVDLSGAQVGEAVLPIGLTLPPGVELLNIKQGKNVTLQIDAISMKQLAIDVRTENSVAPGYTSYVPEVSPSLVVIRGSQQILDNLAAARATVDLNQATSNLVLNLPVELLDKNGGKVSADTLELNPKTVQVVVPVIQNIPTKTVPIKAALVGQPKAQWQVYRVVLEPETVKIAGSYGLLEKIDHVLTQPIDITGLQEDLVTQVGLISPEGVSLLYEPAIKVVVQIVEAPITQMYETAVTTVGQPEGTSVQIKPAGVTVTVQGAREQLSALKNSLKALVDLTGRPPGTYILDVRVEGPENILVTQVEPGKVEVTISRNTQNGGNTDGQTFRN